MLTLDISSANLGSCCQLPESYLVFQYLHSFLSATPGALQPNYQFFSNEGSCLFSSTLSPYALRFLSDGDPALLLCHLILGLLLLSSNAQ